MESLIELVSILSHQKTRHNHPLIDTSAFGDKMSRLYDGVASGAITTNAEGLDLIYGGYNLKSFSSLKSRLEKKLINSLFLIDINKSSFNESNIAYFESFRYYAAVKILFQKKSYKTGLKLAEKLFTYSLKYEFHEITISISRDLRRIYGIEQPNDKKFNKYSAVFKKIHPIYMAEIEAEEVTATLQRIVSKQTNFDYSAMSIEIEKKLDILQKMEINSFSFNKYLYVATIYHEQLKGNYERIIDICDIAIDYFNTKKYPVDFTLNIFRIRKILALINANKLNEATFEIANSPNISKEGSRNWHFIRLLEFLVKMYTMKYREAHEICRIASSKENVNQVHDSLNESWRIFNAYLQFLIARKILILDESEKTKFSINKFLNEVPQYSKDKQGLNVAIHIIHILFLIHLRKFNVIIDRMESLQLYTYRHLRRDATFRSNCFIKMLVQIPKGNFVRKRVVRYTDKYWTKLQTAPLNVNNQQMTLEIIPYETLWEMVLDMLD